MKTDHDEAMAEKAKRATKAPHEPGPCNRRHTLGDAFRRHLKFAGDPEGTTRHVTKGRVRSEAPGAGREIISVPPGPRVAPLNVRRIRRNFPKASVPGSVRRAKAAG